MVGGALWGIHMGWAQGFLVTSIAKTVPVEYRGSAFGMFNLVSGVVLFVASQLAGFLCDHWSMASGPNDP